MWSSQLFTYNYHWLQKKNVEYIFPGPSPPLWLANLDRAADAYTVFCYVITSRHSNRRLQALYPSYLLDIHALCTCFYPVEPPQPSTATAQDLVASVDFGFSFLPALEYGFLINCYSGKEAAFTTVAVCDPCTGATCCCLRSPKT
jgi:hypothetical protein